MSRLKRFARSLLSGYTLLGANALYTFASVPLALHYLSRAEFGLWALTMQIAGYIGLIDAGMSGSVSRILIDYKDHRADGNYGSTVKTGALVGVVQGGVVLVAGFVIALGAGSLLQVPGELQTKFFWLLLGQSCVLALAFGARICNHMLLAHQRVDVTNYSQSVLFGVGFLLMWAGFAGGLGVFSFLIAQAVSTICGALINCLGCIRLRLLPEADQWGEVTWKRFKELFVFGRDVFLYTIGGQFVNASQTVLLTRFLGLDVAAVWSVCTRTYTLLTFLIWRIMDYSNPALAEMMVRKEPERLRQRFQEIALLSGSLSIFFGVLFAVGNTAFVQLWTHGKITWSPLNDLLLGMWLAVSTTMRTHVGLAGATKRFGFLCYVFLFEGLLFVGINIIFHKSGGVTLMLAFSVICTAMCSLPYGLWRTHRFFGLNWRELASWYQPSLKLLCWFVPLASLCWWMTRHEVLWLQLTVNVAGSAVLGGVILLRCGLGQSLPKEIGSKLPASVRRLFVRLALL